MRITNQILALAAASIISATTIARSNEAPNALDARHADFGPGKSLFEKHIRRDDVDKDDAKEDLEEFYDDHDLDENKDEKGKAQVEAEKTCKPPNEMNQGKSKRDLLRRAGDVQIDKGGQWKAAGKDDTLIIGPINGNNVFIYFNKDLSKVGGNVRPANEDDATKTLDLAFDKDALHRGLSFMPDTEDDGVNDDKSMGGIKMRYRKYKHPLFESLGTSCHWFIVRPGKMEVEVWTAGVNWPQIVKPQN